MQPKTKPHTPSSPPKRLALADCVENEPYQVCPTPRNAAASGPLACATAEVAGVAAVVAGLVAGVAVGPAVAEVAAVADEQVRRDASARSKSNWKLKKTDFENKSNTILKIKDLEAKIK